MTQDEVTTRLAAAIAARDAEAFEDALTHAYRAGLPSTLSELLGEALLMDWHTRHEDVASALQQLKDPKTVDALFTAATATHAYLDYDEFFGLARKCTWALADIGTPQAKDHLRTLAKSTNELIAGYAQKRLDRWDAEAPRKRQ